MPKIANATARDRKRKKSQQTSVSVERRDAVIAHHQRSRLEREGQKTKSISLRLPINLLKKIEELRKEVAVNGKKPTLSEFIIDVISFNLNLDDD